ncbi:MAG: hypothetical protein PUB07_02505 [Clostridia bacterium]|nr:hypothetical protein [Clostridia bacterium]
MKWKNTFAVAVTIIGDAPGAVAPENAVIDRGMVLVGVFLPLFGM